MDKLKYKWAYLTPIYEHPNTGELGDLAFMGLNGWNKTNLVHDMRTGIIYYEQTGAPYISENGKFCRFVEGTIVEVC